MLSRPWPPILLILLLGLAPALAGDPPIPKRKPDKASQPQSEKLAPAPQSASDPWPQVSPDAACQARLTDLGVRFDVLPSIADAAPCELSRPLRITRLAPGGAFLPDGTLNCLAAEALARWTQRVLGPAAADILSAVPTGVRHGSTYVCRTRSSGKPSEHALGNAVDIVGFEFAERGSLSIKPRAQEEGPERSFQNQVRRQACAYFTTVLGPGSDDAHANHLHLDLRQRKRGYRICQ